MVGTNSKQKLRPTSIHRIGIKAIDFSFHQGSFHPSIGRERNGREETNATASEKTPTSLTSWKIAAQHALWFFFPLWNYCSVYSSSVYSSSLYVLHFRKEFEWSGSAYPSIWFGLPTAFSKNADLSLYQLILEICQLSKVTHKKSSSSILFFVAITSSIKVGSNFFQVFVILLKHIQTQNCLLCSK